MARYLQVGVMIVQFICGHRNRHPQDNAYRTYERVGRILFSLDSAFVSGGWRYDGKVQVWDIGTESLKTILTADDYGLRNLSFSPDGKTLAGSSNRAAFLWDIETGVVKLTLTGHTYTANSVSFSLDGKMIASLSQDRTVFLSE